MFTLLSSPPLASRPLPSQARVHTMPWAAARRWPAWGPGAPQPGGANHHFGRHLGGQAELVIESHYDRVDGHSAFAGGERPQYGRIGRLQYVKPAGLGPVVPALGVALEHALPAQATQSRRDGSEPSRVGAQIRIREQLARLESLGLLADALHNGTNHGREITRAKIRKSVKFLHVKT